jgi:hypothetical protein
VAADVTNLNVNDALAPTAVTNEQVNKTAKAFKTKMYESGKYKLKSGKNIASTIGGNALWLIGAFALIM